MDPYFKFVSDLIIWMSYGLVQMWSELNVNLLRCFPIKKKKQKKESQPQQKKAVLKRKTCSVVIKREPS